MKGPVSSGATAALTLALSASSGFVVVFIYGVDLIRRRRYLSKAPLSGTLYSNMAVQVATSFGIAATAGIAALSLVTSLPWTLLLLWTLFAFVAVRRTEATLFYDTIAMIAAKRYGRRSAEANAIRYSQMLRTSVIAAVLVTELFGYLMWKSSGHSIGATLGVLGVFCCFYAMFMSIMFGSGCRMAKRVLADLKNAGLLEHLEQAMGEEK